MKPKKFPSDAQRKAAMAHLRQRKTPRKPAAGPLRAHPPSTLDVRLRPILEARLGWGHADAVQDTLAFLRNAPKCALRDRPGDLTHLVFERLKPHARGREGDGLVLAAEVVRTAALVDALEILASVRRKAEAEFFEDTVERDAFLATLHNLSAWVEAGRSLPAAIQQSRIEWGPGMPAAFLVGVEAAFQRVQRSFGGAP